MNKNFHYVIPAIPAKAGIKIKDFEPYFPSLKRGFNNHTVKNNPKEIRKRASIRPRTSKHEKDIRKISRY